MYASLSTLPGKLNWGLISARRWALVKLTGCEDDNVCLVRPSWGRFSEVQFKKFYPLINLKPVALRLLKMIMKPLLKN